MEDIVEDSKRQSDDSHHVQPPIADSLRPEVTEDKEEEEDEEEKKEEMFSCEWNQESSIEMIQAVIGTILEEPEFSQSAAAFDEIIRCFHNMPQSIATPSVAKLYKKLMDAKERVKEDKGNEKEEAQKRHPRWHELSTADEVIAVYKFVIFDNKNNPQKHQELTAADKHKLFKHQDLIITYFKENINGGQLSKMTRKVFVDEILKQCKDKKMEGILGELYAVMTSEKYKRDIPRNLKNFYNDLNKIPKFNTKDQQDPFPESMFKSFWQQSDDNNMETLIDKAIRKVEKMEDWKNIKYIKQLYEDGIQNDDEQEILSNFIERIYEKAGGHKFFDEFVEEQYEREIKSWKLALENHTTLTTDKEIKRALVKLEFDEWDVNADGHIDFEEFEKGFIRNDYSVESAKLREIFDSIHAGNEEDWMIAKKTFIQWKKTRLIHMQSLVDIKNDMRNHYNIVEVVDAAESEEKYHYDENEKIDFLEFKQCFEEKLSNVLIRKLFDQIDSHSHDQDERDGKISRDELRKWKRNYLNDLSENKDNEEDELWAVYYNEDNDGNTKTFTFTKANNYDGERVFDDFNSVEDKSVEWAVYVNEFTESQQKRLKGIDDTNGPNGQWIILNDDDDNILNELNGTLQRQIISRKHLTLIYKYLHHDHDYLSGTDNKLRKKSKSKAADDSINHKGRESMKLSISDIDAGEEQKCQELELENVAGAEPNDFGDQYILFLIEGTKYRLIWWNHKGKHETNAIGLIKRTYGHDDDHDIEFSYLRFPYNVPKVRRIWKMYEEYEEYEEYVGTNYDGWSACVNTDKYKDRQLEASFLGNVKQNFDPERYKKKFNKCLYTEYAAGHVFCVSFSDENRILGMELIGLKSQENTPLRRLIDGRNCLNFIYRGSNKFVKEWQIQYRLYTEPQQLYYFAFIVSIVAMMKYIDIEFSNQPVLLPTYPESRFITKTWSKSSQHDERILHSIQPKSANAETKIAATFDGSTLPRAWTAALLHSSKESILRKFKQTEGNVYVSQQHKKDHPHLYFTEQEAKFLRLLECVRKYAVEYETANTDNTEYSLWPWYRNSFHCDDEKYDDMLNYDEMVYKSNFTKAWSLNEVLTKLNQNTEEMETEKTDIDAIRFKRIFAAEMLLSPPIIARNINLIRNQLHPLLDDILHNALREESTEENEAADFYARKTYEIICKSSINDSPQIRTQRVQKYCVHQICRNKQEVKKLKISEILNIAKKILNRERNEKCCISWKALEKYLREKQIDGNKLLLIIKDKFAMEFIKYAGIKEKNEVKQYLMLFWSLISKSISAKRFWPKQVEATNDELMQIRREEDSSLNQNNKNLSSLDIDPIKLPIFKEFVDFYFIESDKRLFGIISDPNCTYFGGDENEWYRSFINTWRSVPSWYTYDHDVLLLELALRNGLNVNKILEDLDGDNAQQYKVRLKRMYGETMDESYFSFKFFCQEHENIYRRLKYITSTIIKNLQDPQYGGNISLIDIRMHNKEDPPKFNLAGLLFSVHQKDVHLEYLKRQQKYKKSIAEKTAPRIAKKKELSFSNCCGCCKTMSCIRTLSRCLSSADVDSDNGHSMVDPKVSNQCNDSTKLLDAQAIKMEHSHDSLNLPLLRCQPKSKSFKKRRIRYRHKDPFIQRNKDQELLHAFHSFNMFLYGVPLAELIVEKIQLSNNQAFWNSLELLMTVLPYSMVLSIMNSKLFGEFAVNQGSPDKINNICNKVLQGSPYPVIAGLELSALLNIFSKSDIIESKAWQDYSDKFELDAVKNLNDSPELLFVLLNLPLNQVGGDSVLDFAIKTKRMTFLEDAGVRFVVNHLYEKRLLRPGERVDSTEMTNEEMFWLILRYPFKFYFTACGYHWIAGTLYLFYFSFICYYVYNRPFDGHDINWPIEIALWVFNWGYIAYEFREGFERTWGLYIKSGTANYMDFVISFVWFILCVMRMISICDRTDFDYQDASVGQEIYIFLFGFQIILLTFRCLDLFSSAPSLGILVKAIKFMAKPVFQILFIFLFTIIGLFFALWTISGLNACAYIDGDENIDCDGYEISTVSQGIVYMFGVFIGGADIDGQSVEEQPYSVIIMIIAIIFGTLILTNLLIALMSTEYENVTEKAGKQLIYNKTELTVDLSKRSRVMPPPFSLFIFVIATIIHWLNFIPAICNPSKANIYAYIDHQWFFNLQTLHVGYCDHNEKETNTEDRKKKTPSSRKVLCNYYFGWIRMIPHWFCCRDGVRSGKWKYLHKACYGPLKRRNDFTGIPVSQYCEMVETESGQKVSAKNKQLLERLTPNTLFCKYCYRPFVKDQVDKELTTPFVALIDYISAVSFVAIPVVWIPLILLFGLFTLKDQCWNKMSVARRSAEQRVLTVHAFDSEYPGRSKSSRF